MTAGGTGPASSPVLRTRRLVLRPLVPRDAAALSAYRSDPEVARFQSWEAPFPLESAEAFIAGLADAHLDTPGEWFQLAVVDAGSGSLLGDVGQQTWADDPRQATVGITLAREAQGHGYATEALTALLDHLLVDLGKHRVTADCDTRNTGSAALLERVGMRREAHHVRSAWWKGEWTDEYVYAVLHEEWAARGPSGPVRLWM